MYLRDVNVIETPSKRALRQPILFCKEQWKYVSYSWFRYFELREEHHKKESLFEQERDYMRSRVEEVRNEYQAFEEEQERRRCWEEGRMKAELQRLREELEECRGVRRKLGLEVFKLVAEKRCRGVE